MLALLIRVLDAGADGALAWIGAIRPSSASALVVRCSRCCSPSSPYVQVFAADDIKAQPANARRQIIAEYRVERGPILVGRRGGPGARASATRSGARSCCSAASTPTGRSTRDSPATTRASTAAPSSSRRRTPSCPATRPSSRSSTFTDLILGRQRKGGAIFTTIRSDLQEAAARALGDLPGAVVAIEPETGDVLALVANPSLRPEHDLVGHRRGDRRGMGGDHRRPAQPADLAREGRAVSCRGRRASSSPRRPRSRTASTP